VGPLQPVPPHWPYKADPLPVGVAVVEVVVPVVAEVVVGVEPRAELITLDRTGNIRDAIIASPAALG
jgi:hypothetical protein